MAGHLDTPATFTHCPFQELLQHHVSTTRFDPRMCRTCSTPDPHLLLVACCSASPIQRTEERYQIFGCVRLGRHRQVTPWLQHMERAASPSVQIHICMYIYLYIHLKLFPDSAISPSHTEACDGSGATGGVTALRATPVVLGPQVHVRLRVARIVGLDLGSVPCFKDVTVNRSETLFTQAQRSAHFICDQCWKQFASDAAAHCSLFANQNIFIYVWPSLATHPRVGRSSLTFSSPPFTVPPFRAMMLVTHLLTSTDPDASQVASSGIIAVRCSQQFDTLPTSGGGGWTPLVSVCTVDSRHDMDRHSINFAQVSRLLVEHLLQARHIRVGLSHKVAERNDGWGGRMSGWLLPAWVKRSLLEFRADMCG